MSEKRVCPFKSSTPRDWNMTRQQKRARACNELAVSSQLIKCRWCLCAAGVLVRGIVCGVARARSSRAAIALESLGAAWVIAARAAINAAALAAPNRIVPSPAKRVRVGVAERAAAALDPQISDREGVTERAAVAHLNGASAAWFASRKIQAQTQLKPCCSPRL